MIKNIEVLEEVKNILSKEFDNVSIAMLEDELFNGAILNGISIEPAGEVYKSTGIGGFSEKEIESISFNLHLVKKQDYKGETYALEDFINEKDKIIELLYCEELLGPTGNFRSFSISTEPLKFTDDETVFAVWIYKINVLGKIRD